jgi:hypothetical protein
MDLSFILHAVKCHAASRPKKVPANPATIDVTKNRFSNIQVSIDTFYLRFVNNAAYIFFVSIELLMRLQYTGRPFDDLWEYMENITAPRIKRDRYGDNLEGSHIK